MAEKRKKSRISQGNVKLIPKKSTGKLPAASFKLPETNNKPHKLQTLKQSKIVLLGFGLEGQATLNWLIKNKYSGKIIIADEKKIDVKNERLISKKFIGNNFAKAVDACDKDTMIIRSAGFSIYKPILKEMKNQGAKITAATNIFMSNFRGRIVGITGSKGKSTTASLIYSILKKANLSVELAGNIGKPMLEILDKNIDIAVLELSSYQLADLKFYPEIAVITSLFPEHLDWHKTKRAYFAAKMKISRKAKKLFFPKSIASKLKVQNSNIQKIAVNCSNYRILKNSQLIGSHNQQNTALAATVAKSFGINSKVIDQAVSSFKPLKHRLEIIGKFDGITFIDDAISTTPESTMAALETFKKEKISALLLGGTDRKLNFSALAKEIIKRRIKYIVLFPDSGERIWKTILKYKADFVPEKLITNSMNEAIKWIYKNVKSSSFVLLSCASPSYTLWKDFNEKGNEFQKTVKKLGKQKPS